MDYDILIVGGHLAGASLALGLSQLPLKVGLVDPTIDKKDEAHKVSDGRTIVLNFISCQILQALSTHSLDSLKTQPIKTIHISEQSRFAMTRLRASDMGLPALGYSVEMTTLVEFLYEELSKTDCELIPAQVKEAHYGLEGIDLTLQNNQSLQKLSAKLLVAADGDNSFLRELFKIPVDSYDYRQSALVATVETTRPHCDTAFERFIPNGSIALLPVAEKKLKLVWIETTANIKMLANSAPEMILDKLQKHMGLRIGKFHTLGNSHFIYSIKYLHALEQIREKFVLIGNSAHVLHPVAAQGFNLSLRDIAVFIETIRQALTEEKNFATTEVLRSYVVKRLPDQKQAENLTHALATLFTHNFWPLGGMRSAAFNALECFPVIKKRFTRFAMGTDVVLPSWVWAFSPR